VIFTGQKGFNPLLGINWVLPTPQFQWCCDN